MKKNQFNKHNTKNRLIITKKNVETQKKTDWYKQEKNSLINTKEKLV